MNAFTPSVDGSITATPTPRNAAHAKIHLYRSADGFVATHSDANAGYPVSTEERTHHQFPLGGLALSQGVLSVTN